MNNKIASPSFLLEDLLEAFPTTELLQPLFRSELVVLVVGFLPLPWVQRHTGKGVGVGEKEGMGLGWPLGGK